jgi:translation elongation factor EF-1beta
MKTLFQSVLKLTSLSLLLILLAAATVTAQGARLQISSLDYLTAKASETVDVNIDEHLMQLTAKFFSGTDADEKKIKELISGLKGIYVKVFVFEREGEYSAADVESIRSQVRGAAWTKILNVNSKKDGAIEVYLMTVGDQVGGLAVLAANPKELTIVNIIGPVDLGKLSELEGQFGVPDLGIEQPAKTKPKN